MVDWNLFYPGGVLFHSWGFVCESSPLAGLKSESGQIEELLKAFNGAGFTSSQKMKSGGLM